MKIPANEICIVINGVLANENKTFWEAKVTPSSVVEIYRKLKETLVKIKFQGKMFEFVASDHSTMAELIEEVIVEESSSINSRMRTARSPT